ncbi:homologous-pairing protein 2 homolog [Battus philenor]|uniref:homologous-pairing protein 2 homolog n=1 Tax=Battus philenor TaxID=42288 RepID=UPI0035D067A5
MASETVLKYLQDTNRPYSCADVTVNLRGAYTKSVIQKSLDSLSEAGKIKCKLYGKQKVYVATQINDKEDNNDSEDYESQFKNTTEDLAQKNIALKEAESKLKKLLSTPTTESSNLQIGEKQNNIDRLNQKLESLRSSTEAINADDKKAITEEHDRYLKEYRKRKRICTDMMEVVLEGYPKSKKNFLEELCIDTDEMVNFKLIS